MNHFEPYLPLLSEALQKLDAWRNRFGEHAGIAQADPDEIRNILSDLETRLEGNYPFHHPQYAGQMLKPPHPVAWLAYALTATINPNNHALDGGPPTSQMEKEAVAHLAGMVGYEENWLGHLTSAGTIANLEALFVSREIHPGKKVAATANAHYTHSRMSHVLNMPFLEIPVSARGVPDLDFIDMHGREIGTLVVTMGTTGLGYVEPLGEMLALSKKHGFRIHADAAYGGFFRLIAPDLPKHADWNLLSEADSIVIDPHKHGLQPYGCGSVLYKDASVGRFFKHDSPYTYFTSDQLHLGEISLECSRAGASAAAFWATLELLPLTPDGLGSVLRKARNASVSFTERVKESKEFDLYTEPDLDIAGYFKIPGQKTASAVSESSQRIFREGMENPESGYHLSLFRVPAAHFCTIFHDYDADAHDVVLLRSVFMKEEHEAYIDILADRLGM
ncbi:pyridoxal phosphate-dependent decarboxylase family protein [Rhodohalobacter mucosus]|uniref:pyridoxal phosphate-dependent decarboxylase family protein n=1 Tax=Rhodohalobacter mucosus TaxID=2079485 RepID=UPI001304AB4D|nr:pyridoxal-dependent decarboxylase [Rhodohalobacter mucosus]